MRVAEVGKGQEAKEGARWKEAMSRARKDRFIVQRAAAGGTGVGAGAGKGGGRKETWGLGDLEGGWCVCVCGGWVQQVQARDWGTGNARSQVPRPPGRIAEEECERVCACVRACESVCQGIGRCKRQCK